MRIFIALLVAALIFSTSAHATKVGEDGLHKQPWFSITFKDVAEDIATAKAAGKRLAIIVEQRGCIYCKKLHETVLSDPTVVKYITDNFMVVQYNMYGDEEVIDTDGRTLTEKKAIRKWGLAFTPTIIFLPETVTKAKNAKDSAVLVMPGAFGPKTSLHAFEWVRNKGYKGPDTFQRYHARRLAEDNAAAAKKQ
jgi:thioredoxin-related protein